MVKILIGCPTSDYKSYCLNEYIEGLKNLTFKADFIIVDNSKTDEYITKIKELIEDIKNFKVIKDTEWFEGAKDRIIHSRNLIREMALKENYDYSEGRLQSAELYEIGQVFQIDVQSLYQETADARAAEKQAEKDKKEKEEFERLKVKFGN